MTKIIPYTFSLPQGSLTATVLPAHQGETMWCDPMVRVDGKVTVSGLAYQFRVTYQWEPNEYPVYIGGHETDARTHFIASVGTHTFFRRVNTQKDIGFSPSRNAMESMIMDCLARLQAQYPQWQQQSVILRTRELLEETRQEAQAARDAAEAADARAVIIERELARMVADLDEKPNLTIVKP